MTYNRPLHQTSALNRTLWFLGGYAFFLIATIATAVYYIANSLESIQHSSDELGELRQDIEEINDDFIRQAKDRKNLFLRGQDPEDLTKYLGRVDDMTEQIRAKTAQVLTHPLVDDYRDELQLFLRNHQELMVVYREGIEIFRETQSHQQGDAYVRGQGGEVGEELTRVLRQIETDRQALNAENRREIRNFLAVSTGVLIIFILACSAVLAVAVTNPIRRIKRFTTYLEQTRQSRFQGIGEGAIAVADTQGNVYSPIGADRYDEVGYMIDTYSSLSRLIEDYGRNLEEKVEARTDQLAQANAEITSLNQRLTAENSRMSAELEVSRQLQALILPKEIELQKIPQLDIAAFMEPASEVGGDYYDILCTNNRTHIGIGDVTGHGLESGMLMLMAQTSVRTLLLYGESNPQKILETLNRTLYSNVVRMNSDRNMTLALLDYDGETVSLTGQHEEVVVVRRNGDLERIDTIDLGFPLGLEEDISSFVAQAQVDLAPGDGIVLYTDGITEAENSGGVLYGLPRLCDLVQKYWTNSAADIRRRVIQDVQSHIGHHKVFDDITLLVLKRPTL